MKRICLPILSCLATLVFLTTPVYSAESQVPNPVPSGPSMAFSSIVDAKPALFEGNTNVFLVNVMINLLVSEVKYGLNESTAIILAYNPLAEQQSEAHTYQPVSNLSVGLKFSF